MEAFRDRVRLWVGERFPQFQQQVETNVNESRNMFQEKNFHIFMEINFQ